MPDDRLIHLALGHSQKINALTDFERGVWLVYKLTSDDFGVMRFSAVTLQEAASWLEARPAKQVLRALETIRDTGLIQTFEHQGRTYCFQHDWQTWQKITHPRQTKQPAPPLRDCDANTRWLMAHHPRGGKLKSWQAPGEKPESTGRKPETNREETGSKPEVLPVETGPVFVDVGNGCVSGERERAATTTAIVPSRRTGLSAKPSQHGDCLAHGPVCFRPRMADKYLGRFGGNHAAMVAWATKVCSDSQDRVEMGEPVAEGDDYAFWAARYDEHFKHTAKPAASARTIQLAKSDAAFLREG
jgi:hypothetical protein